MKKRNGLRTAHWILLSLTTVALIVGIVISVVSKVDIEKMIPNIISTFGIVVTIVLDGIGEKREKKEMPIEKNVIEHAKAGRDLNAGGINVPNGISSENWVTDVSAERDVNVGNVYKKD